MATRRSMAFIWGMAAVLAACDASGAGAGPSGGPVASAASPAAAAGGCVVGVSWADRIGHWGQWDEPAIKAAVAAGGGSYVSSDAGTSEATQASDIDRLIADGVRVLIILAQDASAIEAPVAAAHAHNIPVIVYDRLIDDPATLYVSFDNVEVGRLQARALLAAAPKGGYAFIMGDKGDANSDLIRSGQNEVLADALKSGAIRNVGETYTDDWDPDLAKIETEAFLSKNAGALDAVLSENDGMAGGVIAALASHKLAGKVAVSGEDGDAIALNEVALGRQTVDVWKDSRMLGTATGNAALALCAGATLDDLKGTTEYVTDTGHSLTSILIAPVAVTRQNLNDVVKAGWIEKSVLCTGVPAGSVAACD
jgi:D-xylose transport system substrate-binding protein